MPVNDTMGIKLQGKNTSITFVYKNKESFVSGIKTLEEFVDFTQDEHDTLDKIIEIKGIQQGYIIYLSIE
ncbi:MAG: hypothetical protein EU529_13805 [Promethearchaeota archaeon]|nr:MAG: hypothetical protein EU529_13805 [Candidatus Lokiarchaeota archaeon]